MGKVISFEKVQKVAGRKKQKGVMAARKGCHPCNRDRNLVEYYQAVDALQVYAVKAFRQTLAGFRRIYRVRLPEDFEKTMRDPHGQLPEETLQKLRALPVKRKQELVYAMVVAVHDGWARDNPDYFFDACYAEERFLYLPIELCGVDIYQKFLEMVKTTVERLSLETSHMEWDTESMYRHKRHKYVCEHGLTSQSLAEHITHCGEEYVALSPKISAALKRDPMLASELASQVSLRAPLGGIEYC